MWRMRGAVNLRQKLLLLLSLMVAVIVAAVAWTVLVRIRQVFEQRDQEETALFVSQFQREFQHRSAEVAAAIDRIAASERMRSMALRTGAVRRCIALSSQKRKRSPRTRNSTFLRSSDPMEKSSAPRSGRRALATLNPSLG
jgi:sensor histidine kinase regulating citrate/malate metabolism